MNKIHLVIFCKSSYKNILPYSSYAAEILIENEIISKTIVTEKYFQYKDYNVLTDEEIWNTIDKNNEYEDLYNFDLPRPGWIKQQILKLSLDYFFDGDILVLDADLIFLKPIKFIENEKYNFHLGYEYDERYFLMNDILLDLDKQTSKYQSFITDFGIFNSNILKEIRNEIENKHQKYWLEVIGEYMTPVGVYENFYKNYKNLSPKFNYKDYIFKTPILSEYELYGNYFFKKYTNKINNIINTVDINIVIIKVPDYKKYTPQTLIENLNKCTENYYTCVMFDMNVDDT
jgi:hypothetical protein